MKRKYKRIMLKTNEDFIYAEKLVLTGRWKIIDIGINSYLLEK